MQRCVNNLSKSLCNSRIELNVWPLITSRPTGPKENLDSSLEQCFYRLNALSDTQTTMAAASEQESSIKYDTLSAAVWTIALHLLS